MNTQLPNPLSHAGDAPSSFTTAISPARPFVGEYRRPADVTYQTEQNLAKYLGWFSVGLGAVELLAPKDLARAIGVNDHAGFLPIAGAREVATGVGILLQKRPAALLWGRVLGDMLDLAFLAVNFASTHSDKRRVAVATAAVAGVTMLDILAAERHSERPMTNTRKPPRSNSVQLRKAITVRRSAADLYTFWRNFENFPSFMRHLRTVTKVNDTRSHWEAHAPLGNSIAWDAEIIDDEPNRRISWRSVGGSPINNSGTVSFTPAPGDRGTEVRVEIDYNVRGGSIAALFADAMFEGPEYQIQEDLRRFKQLLETGEIATTEGQPTGRGGRTQISGL